MPNKLSHAQIISALRKSSTPARLAVAKRYFKTGKGEYGEGDIFFGVTVPETRKIVKQYKDLPMEEIKKLLTSKYHEARLAAAFYLVANFKKNPDAVFKLYMQNARYMNNWDLVDSSAPYLVGPYLCNKNRSILDKLARSKNLWERRIAMMGTFDFIRKGDSEDALRIATVLLHDKHDLIHKAVGWMLREIGSCCSEKILLNFLDGNVANMSRTTLRYAIEKLSEGKKRYYLAI